MTKNGSRRKSDPPFEVDELRREIEIFLEQPFLLPDGAPLLSEKGKSVSVGGVKWGVYAFFDYDDEPIYVGQTCERIGSRIRRHLTNQRTDAVAMSVLDPFEVRTIQVWPLPEYQQVSAKGAAPEIKAHLDGLEWAITQKAIADSKFGAILNEKDPETPVIAPAIPASVRGSIVSAEVVRLRSNPDIRLARRASTISRLAQVISEREVSGGLRRALATQAMRLQELARLRYEALGGPATVPVKDSEEDLDDEDDNTTQ